MPTTLSATDFEAKYGTPAVQQFKQPTGQTLSAGQFNQKYGLPSHAGVRALIANKSAVPKNTSTGSNFLSSLGHTLGNVAIGAAKGAAHTVTSSTSLIQSGLNAITKPVSQLATGKQYKSTATPTQAVGSKLNTSNTAQKVGYGTEQVAEFLAPDSLVKDAEGALQAATKASDLGEGATKVLNFVSKSALAGGENAAVTAAQGGNAKQTAEAGIFGSLAPTFEGVLKYSGQKLADATSMAAEQLADTAFGRTFGERKEDLMKSLKGLPTFASKYLENGKWFSSASTAMDTMQNKILPEAGRGLQKIADSDVGSKKIVTQDLSSSLEDGFNKLEQELGKDNPIIQKLKAATGSGKQIVNPTMEWRDGQKLKQTIYEVMPRNAFKTIDGQPTKLSFVADQLRDVASKLNDRLGTAAEGTDYKKLNQTYGLFKESLQSLVEKESRQSFSLVDKLAAGSSAAYGAMTHNPYVAAAGAAGVAAEKAATSVPGALAGAFSLNKLGNAADKVVNSPITRTVGRAAVRGLLSAIGKKKGQR